MMEWLWTILSMLAMGIAGIFGATWLSRRDQPKTPPEVPPTVKLDDEDFADIEQQLRDELDLVKKVQEGEDPDAYLDALARKRAELESRLAKLGKS